MKSAQHMTHHAMCRAATSGNHFRRLYLCKSTTRDGGASKSVREQVAILIRAIQATAGDDRAFPVDAADGAAS
jgi:hypothetical protein